MFAKNINDTILPRSVKFNFPVWNFQDASLEKIPH